MNHTTRTTEIYSWRRECTRKTHVSVGTEYCQPVSKSFNQQKTARAWPWQAGGGAFPPPCRSCSPGSSRPPTTTPPNSRWISQPQTTSRLARASSARAQGSLREAGAGAGPGATEAALRAWRTHGVDFGQTRPPYSTGTCCRALQRRSEAPPPAPPVLRAARPVGPASPALFHHNFYPTRWGPALPLSGPLIAVQGSWSLQPTGDGASLPVPLLWHPRNARRFSIFSRPHRSTLACRGVPSLLNTSGLHSVVPRFSLRVS